MQEKGGPTKTKMRGIMNLLLKTSGSTIVRREGEEKEGEKTIGKRQV
jgi:hypothetical protein